MNQKPLYVLLLVVIAFIAKGCTPTVAVEGGDKPIHIVMDINLRVARQLDDFFSFEDKPGATTTPSISKS